MTDTNLANLLQVAIGTSLVRVPARNYLRTLEHQGYDSNSGSMSRHVCQGSSRQGSARFVPETLLRCMTSRFQRYCSAATPMVRYMIAAREQAEALDQRSAALCAAGASEQEGLGGM